MEISLSYQTNFLARSTTVSMIATKMVKKGPMSKFSKNFQFFWSYLKSATKSAPETDRKSNVFEKSCKTDHPTVPHVSISFQSKVVGETYIDLMTSSFAHQLTYQGFTNAKLHGDVILSHIHHHSERFEAI